MAAGRNFLFIPGPTNMPEPVRRAIGQRGQDWVRGHFNADLVAEQTLRLYADAAGPRDKTPVLVRQAGQY